jgi:hypothetical protein
MFALLMSYLSNIFFVNTLTATAIFRNLFVEANYRLIQMQTRILQLYFVRFLINFLFMQASIDFLFFS